MELAARPTMDRAGPRERTLSSQFEFTSRLLGLRSR
jgi:hypothetical protein